VTDTGRLDAVLAGRYVIERELGHGGMATVYLARDERHQRMVAVKVMRPDFTSMLGAERFLREIRISANLQHPHILTLIDSGAEEDVLYYVMPFAEGESLRDRLARGALPASEAVRYLHDVLDALAYAHARGVVHRDIKPDNIMLSGRHALVVDFGVAKAVSAAKQAQPLSGTSHDSLTQIGTSVGTPAYMAPEQAAGDPDVDHRADIYAAGVVAYEMLAGRTPFSGAPQKVLAAQISGTPEPISAAAPHTPPAIAALVMRCLEKDPAARFQSADEMLAALESLTTPDAGAAASSRRWIGRRGIAAAAAVVAVMLAAGAYYGYASVRDRNWAHRVALPEIRRLVEANQFDSAFVIATRAEAILGSDSTLADLWPRLSAKLAFTSTAPGARVWRTTYADSLGWTELGLTPTDSVRVPLGLMRYRFELAGYRTVDLAGGPPLLRGARVILQPEGSPDAGMVYVTGGRTEVAMPGLSGVPRLTLPDYLIDRHEVTNAEYKRFLDAGGYSAPEYWEHEIVDNGRVLTASEARAVLVDRTGRPGPATWEGGDFPAGQGDLPVSGISWYEAAAYARFAGKELPTIYHWSRASGTFAGAVIIPGSNYGSQAPLRGSTFRGMSPYGSFDMAGNVREWTWNATGEKRFIFGGGWIDASYSFSDAYAQLPLDRSPINGIRLVKAAGAEGLGPAETRAAFALEQRDYTIERPASDEVFRGFTSFFEYDRTPLDPKLEYRDTTPEFWIRERVSFDAAYGGERMAAVLFIPKQLRPPAQTVVVMGGSNYLYTTSDSAINPRLLDFAVKGGRIVVWPIYKGMFERNIGLLTDSPQETSAYRDLMVMMVKDTRRTIDYLVTRPDVDSSRIAYFGYSFGGRVSPPILASEPRFKAAVLVVAGLKMERARPEVDPINFLPRVRLPLIMLNGRHDFYFPVETSQKPFFDYLGTAPEHRKWVVYPEAHNVPRTEGMRETLNWFDRYLGVVRH
jgi:eukaryotic-like serine/threonine-protein kinase